MQIGDDFYEDLTPETTLKIVDALAKGEKPKPGPQSGRHTSENSAGLTTLTGTVSHYSTLASTSRTVCGLATDGLMAGIPTDGLRIGKGRAKGEGGGRITGVAIGRRHREVWRRLRSANAGDSPRVWTR